MNNSKIAAGVAAGCLTAAAVAKIRDHMIVNAPMTSIEVGIEYFRQGKPLIVMDDEDRENEGDIILPAQDVTEEIIALMVNETTGILCAPMTEARANALSMYPMVTINTDSKGTAFTVTTDLAPVVSKDSGLIGVLADEDGNTGLTTGVSAEDRVRTFKALAHPLASAADFGRPGHIFPLRAKKGGVQERRGHTEAAVDLCRLAGKAPVGCIGELVKKDGSMMRLPDCKRFGAKYGIPCVTIDALANYLYRRPLQLLAPKCDVVKVAQCTIPITRQGRFLGQWRMHCFLENGKNEHIVMEYGDIQAVSADTKIPVRIHSECFTGDLLGSMRCDCGEQLDIAFNQIAEHGVGAVIYMTGHEGRGIGLVNKMHAYELQSTRGYDTYRANRELGFADDQRSFDACVDIIRMLGVNGQTLQLLTNSPLKVRAMQGLKKLTAIEVIPLLCPHNQYNDRYLTDKRNHETRLREGGLGTRRENISASLRLTDRKHLSLIPKLRIAIVRTVWFGVPLKTLQKQVMQYLSEAGVDMANVSEVQVAGAAHLPYAAKSIAETKTVDAILALGITLKGSNVPHDFNCISSTVANGLELVQMHTGTPVLFGVLACEHKQQMLDRCSRGSELPYALALSVLQVATQARIAGGDRAGNMLNFPPVGEGAEEMCKSPMSVISQAGAAPEVQYQELGSSLHFPREKDAASLKVTLVTTTWNQAVVDSIVNSVIDILTDYGMLRENISVVRVPGTFEIPYAAAIAGSKGTDAVLSCGVLLKGESAHFEYVSMSEVLGSVDVQLQHNVPIVSGVVLCGSEAQLALRAKDRPYPIALSLLHQAALSREARKVQSQQSSAKVTAAPNAFVWPHSEKKETFSFGRTPEDGAKPELSETAVQDIPRVLEKPSAADAKTLTIGVVRTAWNEAMVEQMVEGIGAILKERGVSSANIIEKVVPGSYELPSGAQLLTESHPEVDVVLCLGILIKGDTKHFEYICQSSTYALQRVQQHTGVPVICGVLMCFSVEQAKQRACRGSVLHDTLAASAIHMGLLYRASGVKAERLAQRSRVAAPVDVRTKEIPPTSLRKALVGELVKDIPRTLQAPDAGTAEKMTIALIATAEEEAALVEEMVTGIKKVFQAAGMPELNVVTVWVPTCFDLSYATNRLLERTNVVAVLAIGVLIEECTANYETACEAASYGLVEASLKHQVPVLFGVLTCNTREQAVARAAAGSELHYSLAMSALHMACMRLAIGARTSTLAAPKSVVPTSALATQATRKLRVGIVRTSWNENQVLAMVEGLRSSLLDAGVKVTHIVEEVVPGTYELPYIAQCITEAGECDVVCLLGAMTRGDVSNFHYVSTAAIRAYTQVTMASDVPVVWAVKCAEDHDALNMAAPDEIQLLTTRIMQAASLIPQLKGEL